VATDVGGVSEAIGSVAGSMVPPRNPAALAHACIQLLRDDKLRQTMGAAARARAVEHFTVDRAISAFDELYTLLGGGPEPAGTAAAPDEATAGTGPQVRVPAAVPGPNSWIVLPPEEERTVVMPRTELRAKAVAGPPAGPDQESTQVVPVFGGGPAGPDPDPTVILPRLRRDWTDPADEDLTVIVPRPVREYGTAGEAAAPQAPAGPPADELTEAAR
jgi:hypothetical protein